MVKGLSLIYLQGRLRSVCPVELRLGLTKLKFIGHNFYNCYLYFINLRRYITSFFCMNKTRATNTILRLNMESPSSFRPPFRGVYTAVIFQKSSAIHSLLQFFLSIVTNFSYVFHMLVTLMFSNCTLY